MSLLKHRKEIIAVDLDGTLAEYTGWKSIAHIGDPYPGAKEFMAELKSKGYELVIYTARVSLFWNKELDIVVSYIRKWLATHDIPYDSIYAGNGKVFADYYIDDKAVPCRPFIDKTAYSEALAVIKEHHSNHRAKGRKCS